MDLLVSVDRGIGEIILSRPQALSALTYEMLSEIDKALDRFASDESVRLVYIHSNCDRAFSAGADIKWISQNGKENKSQSEKLFTLEYQINRKIYHYPKPYLALINGITMGGGVGLSMHAKRVIATSTLQFAMPEVKIGYFPDVGSCHFLTKLPKHVGLYLAMTGQTISAEDAAYIGLIEHVIADERKKELKEYLPGHLSEALINLKAPLQGSCSLDLEKIDDAFSKKSVEEIEKRWEEIGGDPAIFEKGSSYSREVALNHYHLAQKVSFDTLMEKEEELCRIFLERDEFYDKIQKLLAR